MLSNAMSDASSDVIWQERAYADRMLLAERVESSNVAATLPVEAADKKELEALVTACELKDNRLERRVRQMLLLPLPVGLKRTPGTRAPALGAPATRKDSEPFGAPFVPPTRPSFTGPSKGQGAAVKGQSRSSPLGFPVGRKQTRSSPAVEAAVAAAAAAAAGAAPPPPPRLRTDGVAGSVPSSTPKLTRAGTTSLLEEPRQGAAEEAPEGTHAAAVVAAAAAAAKAGGSKSKPRRWLV